MMDTARIPGLFEMVTDVGIMCGYCKWLEKGHDRERRFGITDFDLLWWILQKDLGAWYGIGTLCVRRSWFLPMFSY